MGLSLSILIDGKYHRIGTNDVQDLKQLFMEKKAIDSLDRIDEISISKEAISITTVDPVFRNDSAAPIGSTDRPINNINAYDWDGNHLWNIADIVGDVKCPFCGGHFCSREFLKGLREFDMSKAVEGHTFFICFSWMDRQYIIDVTDRKVINELHERM